MILKGSQRAGARQLAAHLMNDRDNDHVQVLDVHGFVASDLDGAFEEAYAISKATKCTQFLFSLSLNPPELEVASEQDFLVAVDRAEQKLGLQGQPRAVVIHEKEGRRHAHAVWSRVDAETLTAINMAHFKTKLLGLSKELYLDHGWDLPKGLQAHGGRSPLNFTLAEWQQAKRQGVDPREIKQNFRDAWTRSDSLKGLSQALEERGYFLARGDRRGVVAMDVEGNVYALSRWSGIRAKEINARIGDPCSLPGVADRRSDLRHRVSDRMRGFIADVREKHARELLPLSSERDGLVRQHREERRLLKRGQEKRWAAEARDRNARLRKGVRGLFDRVTGRAKAVIEQNEREAWAGLQRDQTQRDILAEAQMSERRDLQVKITALRQRQKRERALFAREVARSLQALQTPAVLTHARSRERERGIGLSR